MTIEQVTFVEPLVFRHTLMNYIMDFLRTGVIAGKVVDTQGKPLEGTMKDILPDNTLLQVVRHDEWGRQDVAEIVGFCGDAGVGDEVDGELEGSQP